jgi:hypothetical protein
MEKACPHLLAQVGAVVAVDVVVLIPSVVVVDQAVELEAPKE